MSDSSSSAHIAVIVVNYGTADLTIAAVDSVLRFHRNDPAVEIHVVDNASPEADAAVLARVHAANAWGDQVILHSETVNHGFGRGNNVVLHQLAARETPPAFVFLLNPDARLENDAISILRSSFENQARVGFAGARIRNADETAASAAFRFPSCTSTFLEAINFGPVSRIWHRHSVALSPDAPMGYVDWVSGAAVMIRFATLQEIGFFDPDFFLYFEEVELMHRAAQKSWDTIYVPDASIIHSEGAATGINRDREKRASRPAYWYRSWSFYFEKTGGRSAATLAGLGWILGATINHILVFLRQKTPHCPLNFYRDFWKLVFLPLLKQSLSRSNHNGV